MARHRTSTPYKSGSFDETPSGTTFGVLGITLTDGEDINGGDVGRYVVVTNGDARQCHRRITAVDTTNNTITVDAPFGVSAFRGLTSSVTDTGFTEGSPVSGNTFVLTYSLLRVARDEEGFENDAGNPSNTVAFPTGTHTFGSSTLFTVNNNNHITMNNQTNGSDITWFVAGNQAFHFRNGIFEFYLNRGPRMLPWIDSMFIFGDVNFGDLDNSSVVGYPENVCTLLDTSTSFGVDATPGGSNNGHFVMYGGIYNVTGTTTFQRGYGRNAAGDATRWFRMIDVDIYGNFGARITGDNSIVINGSATGYEINNNVSLNIGYFNPLAPGLLQGMAIRNSQQVLYNFPDIAGTTTVPQLDVQDIGGVSGARIIRANHVTETVARSMTLRDWSISDLQSIVNGTDTRLYHVDNATAVQHQLFLDKTVNFNTSILNRAGASIAGSTNYNIRPNPGASQPDTAGTLTSTGANNAVTGGTLTQVLRAWDFNAANTVNDFNDTDAVDRTPYTYAFKTRNQILQSGSNDLSGPSGAIDLSLIQLPDVNITNTTTSLVDGYTRLETAAKIYDAADGFKFNDLIRTNTSGEIEPALPLTAVPFTRSGNIISSDYNIVLDEFSSVANNMFLAGSAININVGSPTATPIVDAGFTVTGESLPDGTNPTINLDGRAVTDAIQIGSGGVSTHISILNVRQFTSPVSEANRSTQYTFGGTVQGHIQVNAPNESDTVYLYFLETSGHAVRIDKTGNGTLVVGGPTAGAFGNASTDGTGTVTSGGITLAPATGIARFEPTPTVERTVSFAGLPDGAQVAIASGRTSTSTLLAFTKSSTDNAVTITEDTTATGNRIITDANLGSSDVEYTVWVSHQTIPRQHIVYSFPAASARGSTTVSGFTTENANVNTLLALPAITATTENTLSSGVQFIRLTGLDDIYAEEAAISALLTRVRNQANHIVSGRLLLGNVATAAEIWSSNDPFQPINAGANIRIDNDSVRFVRGVASEGQQELPGAIPTRTVQGTRFVEYEDRTLQTILNSGTSGTSPGFREARAVPPRVGGSSINEISSELDRRHLQAENNVNAALGAPRADSDGLLTTFSPTVGE